MPDTATDSTCTIETACETPVMYGMGSCRSNWRRSAQSSGAPRCSAALRPPDTARPPSKLSERAQRASRAVLSDRRLALPVRRAVLCDLFAIVAPIVWSHGPDTQDLINSLQGPSFAHPMGTDQLGRDVFARVAERRAHLAASSLRS